jgi:hypothetical protein
MREVPGISLPFGKHKGVPLTLVPTGYLSWALSATKLSGGLRLAVGNELRRRNVDVPAPAVRIPVCERCDNILHECRWQENAAGQRVIRAECRSCHGFLAFVPTIEPYIGLANENASATPILDVLTKLDDLGIEVKSDGRRAWIPWPDNQQCPPAVMALIRQCNNQLARLIGPSRN